MRSDRTIHIIGLDASQQGCVFHKTKNQTKKGKVRVSGNIFKCKIVSLDVSRGKTRGGKNATPPMIDVVVKVIVTKQEEERVQAEFSIKHILSFSAAVTAVSFDASREERFRQVFLGENASALEVEEKALGTYRFTGASISSIREVIGTGTPARKTFAVPEGAEKVRSYRSSNRRDKATFAEAS